MLQKTKSGLRVSPHNKAMPEFFLYGQTIQPIALQMTGPYELISFQLYPFVLKSFFGVSPATINDGCYDLSLIKDPDIGAFIKKISKFTDVEEKIEQICHLLDEFFNARRQSLDYKMLQVLQGIIQSKGLDDIAEIAERLKVNVRTLQRRFLAETGLTPKQFAKIIQFQSSLQQLSIKDHTQLSDIVFENGYSDQSHFIKVFKAFTGKTPGTFKVK